MVDASAFTSARSTMRLELISGAIVLSATHSSGIVETEQMDMADKTRREYRNRIRRIYTWLMDSTDYTSYFEQGTRVVP